MLTEIHEALEVYQSEEGSGGGVNGGVNEVLAYIQRNPGNRARAIAKALKMSLRSVERYLSELKKQGKTEFRGAPRNGGYFLKDEGERGYLTGE